MIINSIILNGHKESPLPRTPHSTDKIKIRPHNSKSLSKYNPNTPSPVINGKGGQKEMNDLVTIKEKVKKKVKEEKKGKTTTKNK